MLSVSEKNVMLSEISTILEVCKSLVSRLSSQNVEVSVQSAPANIQHTTLCSDDEMWWDQSDVSGQMSFDPNNNNLNVEVDLDDSIFDDGIQLSLSLAMSLGMIL